MAARLEAPGRPDTGPYEVIHLGGQAAVVVPVTDFLRLRALELHAFAEELKDAGDAAAPARSPAAKRRPGSDRPGSGASLPFPDRLPSLIVRTWYHRPGRGPVRPDKETP